MDDRQRLCGKLERAMQIPDKKLQNAYSEKNTPLKGIVLRAYERTQGHDCCATAVIAESISKGSGAFEFKTLLPNDYWLVATVGNHEYKMSIRVQSSKRKEFQCSELSYAIEDSGEFTLRKRVTVD